MIIYNCHTHVFNMASMPKNFLKHFGRDAAEKVLGPTIGRPLGWGLGAGLGNLLMTKTGRFAFSLWDNAFKNKFAAFANTGSLSSQEAIFEKMVACYPPGSRFVALSINFDFMGAGESNVGYEGQLMELAELRAKYPDTLLPFLGIDPRHPKLLDFVKKWVNNGFVGLKLYPSLGYFPFDRRLEKVYEFAIQNKLPIMTHCTRHGIYYNGALLPEWECPDSFVQREPERFIKPLNINTLKPKLQQPAYIQNLNFKRIPPFSMRGANKMDEANEIFTDCFLDPNNYLDVLYKYPELKICFAHYGGDDEMLHEKPSWYYTIQDIIKDKRFPNTYTDVSFSLHNTKIHEKIKQDLAGKFRGKVLFGTDYFMTEQKKSERQLAVELQKYLEKKDWQQIAYENAKNYLTSKFYTAP